MGRRVIAFMNEYKLIVYENHLFNRIAYNYANT